mmetsp:Transcript_38287/g.80052  ORF Transcript_38287/g.80052 Transcript_38287/m.80052 type:complete len:299 (-) Transcript_38287:824-1720(-)
MLVLDHIGSHSDGLHSAVVDVAHDAEVAVLPPLVSPRVLHDPILLPKLLTPADEEHRMVDLLPLSRVGMQGSRHSKALLAEDTTGIEHEVVRGLEADNEGPILVQLEHHRGAARVPIEAAHVAVVGRTVALPELFEVAIDLALALGRVGGAGGRQEADVLGPLRGEKAIAAFAALVVLRAVEREGNGPRLRLRIVYADLVPGGQHPHSRHHIAATAISLVHHLLDKVLPVADIPPVEILRQLLLDGKRLLIDGLGVDASLLAKLAWPETSLPPQEKVRQDVVWLAAHHRGRLRAVRLA